MITTSQKTSILFIFLTVVLTSFVLPFYVSAQEKLEIHFFKTDVCLHCKAEDTFLTEMEEKYSYIEVRRYNAFLEENQEIMLRLAKEHGAERYLGTVPLTFIGDEFFSGFDNADGIGQQIESAIKGQSNSEQNLEKRSLFVMAITLGFLDGFNVCSLGAIALILGLVLTLGSRKKILLFGGTFILTTAIIYGLLIILWYKFFSLLTPFMRAFEIGIGLLGLIGATFFFRQFLKFKKYGPTCEMTDSKTVNKLSQKLQNAFKNPRGILTLVGIIFSFSVIITIVEFPCSAAIPVMFAGILSTNSLSTFSYLFYISLFVFFYMLDELIVFAVAVSKMHLWLTSSKWTTWITLAEALILGGLGLYYLIGAL